MLSKRLLSAVATVAMTAGLVVAGTGFVGVAAAQKGSANEGLQREVLHQLRMLNYYTVFDNLEFGVDGSRVTLEGQVTNSEVKHEAVAAVKSVPGVTDVQDNIKVLPASIEDDRIRRQAYRLIYGDPQLSKYGFQSVQSIHIIVDNGHISLEGNVDSATDKNVAGIRANTVQGAFSVKNNLLVRGER
jgi:hyperosmotically inducible protein